MALIETMVLLDETDKQLIREKADEMRLGPKATSAALRAILDEYRRMRAKEIARLVNKKEIA
jgi:hypothetical protein